MKKDELMKYAERGVRDELEAMQAKINELARLFPHIVCHQDGTIPAVLPIRDKAPRMLWTEPAAGAVPGAARKERTTERIPRAQREAAARAWLAKYPKGATSKQYADDAGISVAHAHKLLSAVGKPGNKRAAGSKVPIRFVVK